MMQMNPSFGANMYNPQMSMSSGGDDMMIIFILVIICSCCMFCVFIYYYVKKSKKDKDKDCLIHSDETTCVADTSCSWDSSLYLCVKSASSDSQKPHCSVSKRVLNKECVSCPKFDENDPRSPLRAKSSAPAPKDGPDTSCTVLQPCPADYHVVNGSCVKCPTGKVNNAASGPPSSNTQCKRPLCSNSQRIVCEVEGTLGTCGERCCCEDCISGYESSSVHVQSPDDATESDVICVPEGEGVSREVSRVPSSQPLKALCPLGYSVDENHNCTPCSAGRTTYTQHNPNGPSTQCDKAECDKGKRSDPSYGGGEGYCRSCLGQETNPGGFRPNDEVYSSCLYCKPNSYIDNGECVKCPGDKENFEAQEKMFLKTDTNMIGEHKCKSKLCSPTEFINCVRDATDSDTWTCSCDPCSSYPTTDPTTELTEATSIHTEYLEDVQNWLGDTAESGRVGWSTECVADCEGAFYISKIDEARALISKCDSSLSSCGVDELKTMKDDLDSLVVKCDSDDKASKMNTIQLAIDDIETLLSQKPCLKNERQTLDAPYCTPCDDTNDIGSYPSSRTIDFSNEHEHTVPRAAALVETECKKPLCSPSQRLTADGCSSDCPANELGAPEYSPSGGCSHDGKIDGTKDASCIPGNGMHYVSPTDATENDYTECRDPTAVVATCGNIDGSGTTVSVANCGSGYTPVTGAGLQTECGGTACDITPGNADHKKCCVEHETCAGRILYEGDVEEVTDGGVITLDIPGETSSLSSSGIIGKKIRFTISSDPSENLIGTINNYEYLNDGDHKISVTYDDDSSESTSVITNKTFIILEELSSSCPTGKISNNNPDIHCIGSSCDFTGLTDPDRCCEVPPGKYVNELHWGKNDCEHNKWYEATGTRGEMMAGGIGKCDNCDKCFCDGLYRYHGSKNEYRCESEENSRREYKIISYDQHPNNLASSGMPGCITDLTGDIQNQIYYCAHECKKLSACKSFWIYSGKGNETRGRCCLKSSNGDGTFRSTLPNGGYYVEMDATTTTAPPSTTTTTTTPAPAPAPAPASPPSCDDLDGTACRARSDCSWEAHSYGGYTSNVMHCASSTR